MLDPQRLALSAEAIGFQRRMGQTVDEAAYKLALQTDYNNQGSAIQVRREKESAKNEIRMMGGQLYGFESNELILTRERQKRQINGYPLRQFSADAPAVLLPRKYGGFPLYNKNQVEYPELVSVFTEPMSAPLQQHTELLGRLGQVQMSNDSIRPFEEEGFINPLTKTFDQLIYNEGAHKQRKFLQQQSASGRMGKAVADRNPGTFISENGMPMSQVLEPAMGIQATTGSFAEKLQNYNARQGVIFYRDNTSDAAGAMLRQNMASGLTEVNKNLMNVQNALSDISNQVVLTGGANERVLGSIESEIRMLSGAVYRGNSGIVNATISNNLPANTFTPVQPAGSPTGLQPQPLTAANLNLFSSPGKVVPIGGHGSGSTSSAASTGSPPTVPTSSTNLAVKKSTRIKNNKK